MTWCEVDGVAIAAAQGYAEEVASQAEVLARESGTAPTAMQFEDVAARWRATQEQLRYVVAVVDAALAGAASAEDQAGTPVPRSWE
jgi:trimethylamine:corrinoid methyltransferase-like protein